MSFLEVKSVGKSFVGRDGRPFEALRGVNLDLAEGEFVSIIGHSGCGKSTVLNLVAGLLDTSSGEILLEGNRVLGPGPDRMVAFQNHSLLPWLTLRQNVRLAVDQVHRTLSRQERTELTEQHLKMVKLSPAADRLPDEVSGGMKQRCGIARALAVQPKVLLLDEPFGALDALTRAKLQDELLRIWEQERLTVMMITHDVDEALLLSDRIVMMSNGPAAQVADCMTVDIPRPRDRLRAVDHPSYYRQRGELLYFLNKCKKAKGEAKRPAPAASVPSAISGGLEKPALTVGFVPLTDAAPFVVAEQEGYFEEQGLSVTLSREPSWKAIADGIREGRLDAAQMVVGMPLSLSFGVGAQPALPVCSALMLSRGGNAITFGHELVRAGVLTPEALKGYLSERSGEEPAMFGMVHPASMHNLLFRDWLAMAGVHPDQDLRLIVIPPPQMVANLRAGNILGYCVGEPWNLRSDSEGLGKIVASDLDIWPDHPEKVLGVSRSWADAHPKTHRALVKALLRACEQADDPTYRREKLSSLLSDRRYVGGEAEYFQQCLVGPYRYGTDRTSGAAGLVSFSGSGKNRIGKGEMTWVLAQMARWGLCPFPTDFVGAVEQTLAPDVLSDALRELDRAPSEDEGVTLVALGDVPFDAAEPREYLRSVSMSSNLRIEEHSSTSRAQEADEART